MMGNDRTSPRRACAHFLMSVILACTLMPLTPGSTAFAQDEGTATQSGFGGASANTSSNTDSDAQRVVKVGYMESVGNITKNDDGTFDGYLYDYLVRVAQFTGWTYEFVEAPGADSNEQATNLLDMLQNGEVDIEGSMTYSPALAKLFEYPKNSYGTAHTALFVPNANAHITQTDLFTQAELRVALLASANKRREELVYFCNQNNINLVMIDCKTEQELFDKTATGEADAFLDIDVNVREGFHVVTTFAGRPYFFAAPKGQREVIDELDATIGYINESNPALQSTLYDTYFMTSESDYTLTDEELAFARDHETLRVGILSEKAPVQSFNKTTGALEGVSKGILDYLGKHAGLSYEVVRFDRAEDLDAALRSADIDILAGIDSNLDVATSLGISLSAPYMTASKLLVYNKFVDPDNLKDMKLAVPWELASTVPTDAPVAVYDSIEACLEAVNRGDADYTYGSSYSTPYYLSVNDLNNLLTLPSSSQTIETCFGLVQPIEPKLLLIINKSIRALSLAELDSIIYDNSLIDQEEQVGLFLRDHLLEVAIVSILLLLLIIVLLALYLRTRMRVARNVREENQRFQKLYSLANEQFFEYSIKNDTLLISYPESERAFMAADADEGAVEDKQPYRIVHNARETLSKILSPELLEAFTSPSCTALDAPYDPQDGVHQWLRIVSHFVTDDTGKPITVIGKVTNIDEEMRERLDLSQRAHHDGLTGLLNWKTFQERASALLGEGKAGALLIIDTDDFKNVNDSYGHLVGDLALKNTADALARAFRPTDLLGRLGGDEFAVCVAGSITHDNLAQRCASIIEHAVDFPDVNGVVRSVTLSIGGVELPEGQAVSYEAAYQQADRALYHAKSDGKDRFLIDRYQMGKEE